jgi:hypothetical protein
MQETNPLFLQFNCAASGLEMERRSIIETEDRKYDNVRYSNRVYRWDLLGLFISAQGNSAVHVDLSVRRYG